MEGDVPLQWKLQCGSASREHFEVPKPMKDKKFPIAGAQELASYFEYQSGLMVLLMKTIIKWKGRTSSTVEVSVYKS